MEVPYVIDKGCFNTAVRKILAAWAKRSWKERMYRQTIKFFFSPCKEVFNKNGCEAQGHFLKSGDITECLSVEGDDITKREKPIMTEQCKSEGIRYSAL